MTGHRPPPQKGMGRVGPPTALQADRRSPTCTRRAERFTVFCRVHGYAATQGQADGGILISGCPGAPLTCARVAAVQREVWAVMVSAH
jgi:hypothetical protein